MNDDVDLLTLFLRVQFSESPGCQLRMSLENRRILASRSLFMLRIWKLLE